jgi:hypothetical protein
MKDYPHPGGILHQEGHAANSYRSPAPRATARSPTLHTFWHSPLQTGSVSIFRTCCS